MKNNATEIEKYIMEFSFDAYNRIVKHSQGDDAMARSIALFALILVARESNWDHDEVKRMVSDGLLMNGKKHTDA